MTNGVQRLRLEPDESVVIVPRSPLGDGLLSLVLAWNLRRAGATVSVVHDQLAWLAEWAPGLNLCRRSEAPSEVSVVVHHAPDSVGLLRGSRANLVLREHRALHRHAPRAVVLRDLAGQLFELAEPSDSYALVPPAGIPRVPGRIVIHPESGERARSWARRHFITLAHRLRDRGFEPHLLVAPAELERWSDVAAERNLPLVARADLDHVGRWLAGSRALIGNDSGIGHLAAAVGLPSVILFTRRRVAERWCPRGAPVESVLPPFELPATFAQRRIWKLLVRPGRVELALERLLARGAQD